MNSSNLRILRMNLHCMWRSHVLKWETSCDMGRSIRHIYCWTCLEKRVWLYKNWHKGITLQDKCKHLKSYFFWRCNQCYVTGSATDKCLCAIGESNWNTHHLKSNYCPLCGEKLNE